MPRQTKLTKQIIERVERCLSRGNTRITAAAVSGVARSSFNEWLRRGARAAEADVIPAGEELYAEFYTRVDKAWGEATEEMIDVIRDAGMGDDPQWQAIAWLLERTRPRQFARRDQSSETAREIASLKKKVRTLKALYAQKVTG